jgi:hypothetical protein
MITTITAEIAIIKDKSVRKALITKIKEIGIAETCCIVGVVLIKYFII